MSVGVLPFMAVFRARAASMIDQCVALRRTGYVWLWGWTAVYLLSVFDTGGSKELVHRVLRDSWHLGHVTAMAVAKASGDALFSDPKASGTKMARTLFWTSLALKSAINFSIEYMLFWLGFAGVVEVVYALTNEYISSRENLAAMTVRNEQLTGEKERLNYELRMQRKQLECNTDDSGHNINVVGALLGVMQDPEVTAKQQEMATCVDHVKDAPASEGPPHPVHAPHTKPVARGKTLAFVPKVVNHSSAGTEEFSPDSIATPLFCNTGLPAAGWVNRSPVQNCDAASVTSVTSSMVRNAPSLVASSVVLPTRKVIKNAPPTWAPAPPGLAADPLLDVAPKSSFPLRRRGCAAALDAARARSEA